MSSILAAFRNCLKFVTAPLLGLLLTSCEMGMKDSEHFIFLNEEEPLYVRFTISMNPELEMSMPDVADNMKDLRRRDYMTVMQELVYLYRMPVDVHILGEHDSPGDGPVLEIYALRFEQDRAGDLVTNLRVKLHRFGELNTLGTYSERMTSPVTISERQLDLAFQELIRVPLREMMEDLMDHFKTAEESDMVEAPLGELGTE
ncbi:hypothetical protein [Pelagicoccus mobilis]|uniref:Lipoprotein n=1 Tax=Pelagicoccus mobilis TaxID=415221 RepID=A0A934S4S6_9BACT|nr:hypothetical protein [Pelagicoccus mobilis]MBK1878988.1 hypothetical protein [Pelagicoccus mobilis]